MKQRYVTKMGECEADSQPPAVQTHEKKKVIDDKTNYGFSNFIPIQEAVLSSNGMMLPGSLSWGSRIAEYPDVSPAVKVSRIEADAANVWERTENS